MEHGPAVLGLPEIDTQPDKRVYDFPVAGLPPLLQSGGRGGGREAEWCYIADRGQGHGPVRSYGQTIDP
jgi:hypothetical protein